MHLDHYVVGVYLYLGQELVEDLAALPLVRPRSTAPGACASDLGASPAGPFPWRRAGAGPGARQDYRRRCLGFDGLLAALVLYLEQRPSAKMCLYIEVVRCREPAPQDLR